MEKQGLIEAGKRIDALNLEPSLYRLENARPVHEKETKKNEKKIASFEAFLYKLKAKDKLK